jgi:hypothetical protein
MLSEYMYYICLQNKGAVLGVYQAKEKDGDLILDKSTQFFDDKSSKKISGLLKV